MYYDIDYDLDEPEQYYIGLNDRRLEGVHEWIDGSQFDFQFWSAGEPNDPNVTGNNQDCGSI